MNQPAPSLPPPVLEVHGLEVVYPLSGGQRMRAVDQVGFSIARGETLALVGESGCGKSSVARAVMQLLAPTQGRIALDGQDLAKATKAQLKRLRRQFQMIFQDPISSLNPRRRVRDILEAPLRINGLYDKTTSPGRINAALELVGLDAAAVLQRFPHEFSGGQCQRLSIARALILEPRLLVCDEPVSALDVSVRAQVLNVLNALRARLGLSMLFISHDLAVVRNVADRVAVMYLGRICEIGLADQVLQAPAHPYTAALLAAVPVADPDVEPHHVPRVGEMPSPMARPKGCRYQTRCPQAQPLCATTEPPLAAIHGRQHVACHFPLPATAGSAEFSTTPSTSIRETKP